LNISPRSFPEENLSGPKAIIMGQGEGMGEVFLLLLEVSAASSPSCSSPSSLHVGRKGPAIEILNRNINEPKHYKIQILYNTSDETT
jgi:hypothetical protein